MPTTLTSSPHADLLLALDASDTGLWTRDIATQAVTWTSVRRTARGSSTSSRSACSRGRRLQLAVESSGIGLWTWDLATDAVTWSSEAYRIHGLAQHEFDGTGAGFFELVHPANRDRVQQAVREALARNLRYHCEFRIVRPDGAIVWVANGGRARYDGNGKPVGMLGTISDLTATRQAELAMQAALEASSAGTFRWDIRTNELWWDDALDRLFGLAPGASVHSLEQFVARVHPDDRAGVLARCERCRTFRDHAGRPASMTGACVDITHRKHTELALRRSESFYRQTLESIRVHSAGEGQGSTFVVRLPAAAGPGRQAAPAADGDAAGSVRPIRVMVVDDNADAAEALSLLLQLTGHEVRVAADGQAALQGARDFRPAVTFLDIGLPGMSGYEVARALKSDPELRAGLLVAITGWGSEDDKRKCLDAGFDLHLTKPVELAVMEKVLAACAGRAEAGGA